MKPNQRFLHQPKSFWANVRTISQLVGYTVKYAQSVKVPHKEEIQRAFASVDLGTTHLFNSGGHPTETGESLLAYFEYRAQVLNEYVRPLLMDADRASRVYKKLRGRKSFVVPVVQNKQTGDKKAPAYFTGIINTIIESSLGKLTFDHDPRALTTITSNGAPLRTLARRVDGAFPRAVNPIAIWEIKEYYYTTTFGSRVADGVYESLLDGLELEELRTSEGIDIKHYLMLDGYFTWWECGRSYLCRIVDMLHMGYIDEGLFGYEVVERLPILVQSWLDELQRQSN